MHSIVSYVGVSENGHCGYCKSAQRAKANIAAQNECCAEKEDEHPEDLNNPSANQKDGNETGQDLDDVDSSPSKSVVFGLVAHCLDLDSFNQLLDIGWMSDWRSASIDLRPKHEFESFLRFLGLWASHYLTVQAYQGLMDRGWRRSGKYLYKPLMERTCCPQYTIRLDVHKYQLSRTQKRVLRSMHDFLKWDRHPKSAAVVREEDNSKKHTRDSKMQVVPVQAKTQSGPKEVEGESTKGQLKKKWLRRKRADERLLARGVDLEQHKKDRVAKEEARRRTVQSFLEGYNSEGWAHKLELRLVGQPSAELELDFEEEFQVYRRYQVQIHRDSESDLSPNSFRRFLASSPLVVPPSSAEEDQTQIKQVKLGSYHQQYRLDGKIIAVAVIDILPRCLSAKYFFYEPDYAFLSLGTYSAIREIDFTRQLALQRPDLHFYYMGFYLFNCPKMRYKGKFRPSELLCDHCFDWVPLSDADRIIEGNGGRFSTFHQGEETKRPTPNNEELDDIRCIFVQRQLVTFGELRTSLAQSNGNVEESDDDEEATTTLQEVTEKVRQYVQYAGDTAFEMILVL